MGTVFAMHNATVTSAKHTSNQFHVHDDRKVRATTNRAKQRDFSVWVCVFVCVLYVFRFTSLWLLCTRVDQRAREIMLHDASHVFLFFVLKTYYFFTCLLVRKLDKNMSTGAIFA